MEGQEKRGEKEGDRLKARGGKVRESCEKGEVKEEVKDKQRKAKDEVEARKYNECNRMRG